ncbi:MAG: alpha/beta hydrolase [Flavobacteriaceae bacterium]|nr:alpha/beta hydrolase [Flavobacteriaceae bacterium]
MKKILLLLALVSICFIGFSQENNNFFRLYQNEEAFDTSLCFNENSEYNKLNFVLDENAPESYSNATLLLYLNEKSSMSFVKLDNFKELKLFNLKFWLNENEAFKNENSLFFEFVLKEDSIVIQQIAICIEPSELNETRGSSNPEYVKMPVYFATDRNYIETDDVYEQFGVKRSDLKYGMCEVSIPHDHKIGHIESPSIWKFEFSEDPEKHIVLHSAKLFDKSTFFKTLSTNIKKSNKKSSFLFVHGYNVSFGDAAKRTAQISYDLLFDGEAVFYSWPSQANTAAYTRDEANIKWAEANIKNFLEDYINKSEAEEIYLVAHSMGNRGLTRAIISLFKERPELKERIKEIILAAPDIDADVFKRDIAPKMVELVQKPITLYVSADDVALKASKALHGYSRAGDSGDGIVLIDGIETIDATGVDTSFLSHSYFADTTSIITDIFDLIKTGKRAKSRKQLKLIELRNSIYWKVKH